MKWKDENAKLFSIDISTTWYRDDTKLSGFMAEGLDMKNNWTIYRGFDYFFQLPIINKVFGIGFKSLESFTRLYGISSVFDKSFLFEYLNSVCQALIYYGILGFCLLFHSYARLFRGCNTIGKVLIIVFLALSVSSSIFLDSTMIMYTLIIFSCRKPNNRR